MSNNNFHYVAYALLFFSATVAAEGKRDESEPKVVSGMSIVGNDETPKSLYMVPWKSSDDGREVNFSSSILNEELKPINKSDFIRELDFYRSGSSNSAEISN